MSGNANQNQDRRAALCNLFEGRSLVVAPGIFDMVSALIADRMGFPALYVSGFATVASGYGLPDAGIATYSEMIDRIGRMAGLTQTPLIADADTGYGGLLNVRHTVRGYEAAGIAAMQLEDQVFPKRCGHTGPRPVIGTREMVRKLEVALHARRSDHFLVIGRTDARLTLGFDEALARGRAFAAAGVDLVFVEALQSEQEIERAAAEISVPIVVNMVPGGSTPLVTRSTMARIGVGLAIYPTIGLMAAAQMLTTTYRAMASGAEAAAIKDLMSFKDFQDLIGMPEIQAFEARFPDVD